jgi:class 3 adenylate cyclase
VLVLLAMAGGALLERGTALWADASRLAVTASVTAALVVLSALAAELAREQLPPQAELRDLGQHRLKDLLQPERIFQLVVEGLPADFPAIHIGHTQID